MKFNVKNIANYAASISAILVVLFGVSLASTIGRFRQVWKIPENDREQDSIIYILKEEIRHAEHIQEMTYEFARLMTDNNDKDDWFVVGEGGEKMDVDIRNTAEGVELAFIRKLFIIYPVYYDSADDGRKYIVMHEHNSDDRPSTYLYKE